MVAQIDGGPHEGTEADFPNTTDLLANARAGAPGLWEDRARVLDGIPLDLTMLIYNVSQRTGRRLAGAEVSLWAADALGSYSAVRAEREDTTGQVWLRGVAITNQAGQVTWKTIVPGWYRGRVMHLHYRVRWPGARQSYAVTSQLFFPDDLQTLLQAQQPYSSNQLLQTTFGEDDVFAGVPAKTRRSMILELDGSVEAGYKTTFKVGIAFDGDQPESKVNNAHVIAVHGLIVVLLTANVYNQI